MPLTATDLQFINRLKANGVDTSSIEAQLAQRPTSSIDGIQNSPHLQIAQQQLAATEAENIQDLSNYVHFRDLLLSLPEGDMKSATETALASLETKLVSKGAAVEDLQSLTYAQVRELQTPTSATTSVPAPVPSPIIGQQDMTQAEYDKLRAEVTEQNGRVLTANLDINNATQLKILEHQQLTGKLPTMEQMQEVSKASIAALVAGNDVSSAIDTALGLPTVRSAQEAATIQKQIEAARAEGERIGLQKAAGHIPQEDNTVLNRLRPQPAKPVEGQPPAKTDSSFTPPTILGREARRDRYAAHLAQASGNPSSFVG